MKGSTAIMTFMNKGQCLRDDLIYPPVRINEIKELKDSCDPDEYRVLAGQACELLGETLE